jgi:regulator of sirC expression with transglutaminase-like and TPR domain
VADPALLQRVTKKQIVVRMLQNLHRVYVRRRDFERAVATLDLMIAGAPETAAWYHARAVLLMEVDRWQAARRDFETYLALSPDAVDRELVVKQIHWLARMN